MTYKIIITESYEKRAKKFFKNHKHLIKQYSKTLELLELNPFHPSLRLHPLHGNLEGLHSVSINISYRITIEFIMSKKKIILINVGSHEAVY